MRSAGGFVAILALAAVSACGDDAGRPGFVSHTGDATRADRSDSDGQVDTGSEPDGSAEIGADAAGDTADAASDTDDAASDTADAGSDHEPPIEAGPTLCPEPLVRQGDSRLSISTGGDDGFGSVSDDELSLAWSSDDGQVIKVFVAERSSLSETFTLSTQLTGDFAFDRAALSPDGLSLIVVNGDRKGFTRFARASRAETFEPSPSAEYDNIVLALGVDDKLGDPVFALGGLVLFYSQYGGQRLHTIIFANRLGLQSRFAVGAELDNPELRQAGTARRRPSGVSSDYRMLFYFDELTQTSKVGSFFGSFSFQTVTDLGPIKGVQPSADCGRLYFGAPGPSSHDLFSGQTTGTADQ